MKQLLEIKVMKKDNGHIRGLSDWDGNYDDLLRGLGNITAQTIHDIAMERDDRPSRDELIQILLNGMMEQLDKIDKV